MGPLSSLVRPEIFGGRNDFLDESSSKGVSSSKFFADIDDEDFSDKNFKRSNGEQERMNEDKDPDKKEDAEEWSQQLNYIS